MISTVTKNYFLGEFVSYQVTYENGKEWSVPLDEANTDYQAIQEWVAIEGNEIIDNGGQE